MEEEERAEPKAERKRQADAETKKEREFGKNGESVWVPSQPMPSLQITGRGYEMLVDPQNQMVLRLIDCTAQLSPPTHPRDVGQGTTRGR